MIRPIGNAVFVRIIAPERMTASKLLWIPETAERAPYEKYQADVLACGPGERCTKGVNAGKVLPMEVRVGDRVLVYWTGLELPHHADGAEVWVSERSIMAVLEAA